MKILRPLYALACAFALVGAISGCATDQSAAGKMTDEKITAACTGDDQSTPRCGDRQIQFVCRHWIMWCICPALLYGSYEADGRGPCTENSGRDPDRKRYRRYEMIDRVLPIHHLRNPMTCNVFRFASAATTLLLMAITVARQLPHR